MGIPLQEFTGGWASLNTDDEEITIDRSFHLSVITNSARSYPDASANV
jgi:type V secretory pathway adhesin AidA